MVTYDLIKEHIINDYCGEYDSYGIAVISDGTELRRISDISTDFEDIEELVRLCNKVSVELVHIDSIVENFLLGDV
ncbi:MAG: DUF6514 family protein [Acutalibacteraceae bacterium]